VFVFFGLVATVGTTYTQALQVTAASALAGSAIGLLACALLMANNIRDIATDVTSGKRTLAVRLGDRRARLGYALMLGAALVLAVAAVVAGDGGAAAAALAVLAAPVVLLSRKVLRGATGPDLIAVLKSTGLLELALGVALGLVLWLG
jgi:1,4-dihydroxy-2-naphthoate octaprenyltransferase